MGALTPSAQFYLPVCVVYERENMSLGFLQAVSPVKFHLSLSLAGVIVAGVRYLRGCVRASSARLSTSTKKRKRISYVHTIARSWVSRCVVALQDSQYACPSCGTKRASLHVRLEQPSTNIMKALDKVAPVKEFRPQKKNSTTMG